MYLVWTRQWRGGKSQLKDARHRWSLRCNVVGSGRGGMSRTRDSKKYEEKRWSRKNKSDARVTFEMLGIEVPSILIPKPIVILSVLARLSKLWPGTVVIPLSSFFHLSFWAAFDLRLHLEGVIRVGVDPRKMRPNYWRYIACKAVW
jgi:hypothetical protein